MATYLPRQGDLVALDFDPQSGHEQKVRRPARVVSKDVFNKATGLAICCPITNDDIEPGTLLRSPARCQAGSPCQNESTLAPTLNL